MPLPPSPERLGLPIGHVNIGDCAFALKPMLMTTVLGSCVCATFHHPGRKAGGMFHAMLPDKRLRRPSRNTSACTFADLAITSMVERFLAADLAPKELVVKLFGGANTMLDRHGAEMRDMLDVGRRNVESALAALGRYGLRPVAQDVLGSQGRKLYFATATGEVWLSYLSGELAAKVVEEQSV